MILKVTPKEALKKIDSLLVEAVELRRDFNEEYWTSDFERVKELLKDPEKFLETAEVRAGSLPSLVEHLDSFKKKVAQELIKTYDELATPALFLALDRKVVVADIPKNGDGHYFYAEKRLDLCIDFLEARHQELIKEIKSPLQYLREKAKLVYFDAVCQLTPNSNEDELCDIMCDSSIGECKEMDEIYEYMKGKETGDFPSDWKKTVRNSIEGVNEKTKEKFGFPIFTIKKNAVSLVIPAELIASYR
ncbi:MAG: hypothetical protein WC777_06055 [Candidatus Gracilibacteria bacterium]|jgi:hypothetical protein